MQENIFPSVSSEIIDNSFAAQIAEGSLDLLQVICSDKGEDGKLKYYAGDPKQFVSDTGEPNLRKYGQAAHNIINWLGAGGGAWVLTVKDVAAAYANAVISLSINITEAADVKKLYVKPTSQVLKTDLVDKSTVLTGMKAITADAEPTYQIYPLIGLAPIGRGKAYEEIGLRLECNRDLDNAYPNNRVYNATVVSVSNGRETRLEGPFLVSLAEGALDVSRQPLFIEKVFKKYSRHLAVTVNTSAFDALAEELGIDVDLMDITSPAIQDVPKAFDFWEDAGYDEVNWVTSGTPASVTVTTDPLFHDFRNPAQLKNGKDGDMSIANQDALKVKGYKGLIDPNVNDINFYPIDIILDANESVAVKAAMASLNKARRDHMAILDCGITATPEQAIELRDNGLQMDSPYIGIWAQDFEVYDEYGQTDVRVTVTNDLASKLPTHVRDFGRHRPFVGPRRGGVGSHTNLSWLPTDPQKTKLYKRQINYIERSPKRLNYATQLTSQTATSHMSNFSVVWTLLRMEKIAKEVADDFRMEFINEDTLGDLQRQIYDNLASFLSNGAMESIEVTAYADAYDKTQKRSRVTVAVVPTSIMERILISFNVNK